MTAPEDVKIRITRGSTVSYALRWGNGAGGAGNLTGYDVSVDDVDPAAMTPAITAVMADAMIGRTEGKVNDDDTIPVGRRGWFRVKLTPQSGFTLDEKTTPRIFIDKS